MLILTFLPFGNTDAALTALSTAETHSKSIILPRNGMLKSQPSHGSPTPYLLTKSVRSNMY